MMSSLLNQKRKLRTDDDGIIPSLSSSSSSELNVDGSSIGSIVYTKTLDNDYVDSEWEACQRMIETMTIQQEQQLLDTNENNNNNSTNTKNDIDTILVQELQGIVIVEQQIDNEYQTTIPMEGKTIKKQIQEQIVNKQEQIRLDEIEHYKLQCQLNTILQEKYSNENEINQLSKQQQQLIQEIEQCKQQVSIQLHDMEQIQDICKQKVPRLRQQLSLYGSVTGIKWNFTNNTTTTNNNNEQLLIGQVNIPSIQTIKRFHINPNDHTRYEVAQMLWNFMDAENNDTNNKMMMMTMNSSDGDDGTNVGTGTTKTTRTTFEPSRTDEGAAA